MMRACASFGICASFLAANWAFAADVPCEELVDSLRSPMSSMRERAASDLAKQNCVGAVGALSALVRDPDVVVRLAVVKALRKLHDPTDVSALTTFTRDGSPEVRAEAVRGLIETYSEPSRRSSVDRVLDVFSDENELPAVEPWVKIDARVYPALAERLRDETASIRRDAALALGVFRGISMAADLAMAANDPDAGVRAQAVTALELMGAKEQGRSIVPLLSDESGAVRMRAIKAARNLRIKEAAPVLQEMYTTNRPRGIQPAALEALSRIGDSGQRQLFLELAQDPDPEKRRLAIEGLARIADRSMLAAFKKDFQREHSEELRMAHAFALTYLGDRAFVDTLVLGLSSRSMGARCRAYIIELGKEYLEDLYPYLRDPDAGIRASLAEILGEMGDPAAIPHLEVLLKDPSESVANEANSAVERLRRLERMATESEPRDVF
jgi:HEAT repeat protein